jgi:RHS repeat-associated protein
MHQTPPIKTHQTLGSVSQRITSKIGGGFGPASVYPLDPAVDMVDASPHDHDDFSDILWEEMLLKNFACVGHESGEILYDPELHGIIEWDDRNEPENQQYFYHPDHLGSSSFITNVNGEAYQHLQYLPFGETFINQRADAWQTRYTFSAKEKDRATGYHYFGARYYDSDVSVWLSVDPMSDEYPSMSPYMYTAGNPVMLVDPNGESISIFDEDGNFIETKKDNWFHNTFVGRKGRVIDGEGNTLQIFKFNDYKNDKEKLIKGKQVLDLNFESKIDEKIDDGAKSINE